MPRVSDTMCPYCDGERRAQSVFKKVWWLCAGCGNATAVRRARYPLDRTPRVVRRVLPAQLFADPEILQDPGAAWYVSGTYRGADARETPYAGESQKVRDLLDRFAIDATGSLLDLSGGPGFVARDLLRTARRVVMTEYSAHVLPFARGLGVDAVAFDYQGAPLETCVTGPFDLILSRYSLNFCRDLAGFLASVNRVASRPATFLLAGFIGPSRGACLTSALEDAGPPVLWHPDFVAAAFKHAGWQVEARFEVDPPMNYWQPRSWRYRLFSLPWEVGRGAFPRDVRQYHHGFVFRRG